MGRNWCSIICLYIEQMFTHLYIYIYMYVCLFKLWIPSFITKNPPHPLRPLSMSPKHFRPLNQGFQLSNLLCLTWQDITEVKKKGSLSHCHGKMMRKSMIAGSYPTFSMLPHAINLCFFLRYTACSNGLRLWGKPMLTRKSVLVCGRNCSMVKAAILVGKWW